MGPRVRGLRHEQVERARAHPIWGSRRAKLVAAVSALVLLNVVIATWTRKRERALQAPTQDNTQEAPSRSSRQASPSVARDAGFLGVLLNGETANLEPKVEARILGVFVKPGDEVAQGRLIAQLDDGGRGQELTGAQAALREASRRLARRIPLAGVHAGAAVTPEELDAARSQVAQERARVAALSALVGESQLRAPFKGVVVEQLLTAGSLTGPGRPVVRLASKGELRVRFAVPEEGAAGIAVGVPLRIEGQSLPLQTTGRVVGVNPQVDVSSRMVYALANLDVGPGLNLQLTTGARVRVHAAQGPRIVSLTEAAPSELPGAPLAPPPRAPPTTTAITVESPPAARRERQGPQSRPSARHRSRKSLERRVPRW